VDIWGTSDQFRFVYQQLNGDGTIVARVDSLQGADPWAKAGVMIRASLATNAANAVALVSAGHGVAFQWRSQAGASSAITLGPTVGAPQWVKLTRAGTTVTSYSSPDGGTWQKVGSVTVALGQTAYAGLAVTSHVAGGTATGVFSQVAVTQGNTPPSSSLPTGQQSTDIGSPSKSGSVSYSSGTYTVSGGGADIWGTSDQFRYVYQQVSGDVDIVARVASVESVNTWTKAGVMVRESLSANARHAMSLISASQGYSFQWRLDTGGLANFVSGGSGAAPTWVRLVRTGSKFEAFRSSNGSTWTSMGSEVVPMADSVYVGLAVTSHKSSQTATAVFDHVAITEPTAPPNQPPTVSLTAPASGATFTAPATITVSANASDPENRLSRVDFFSNGTSIGSRTASPFSISYANVAAGTYSLTAVATDASGSKTTSSAVTIDVRTATNKPPTVSLTSPSSGATFTAGATISLAATASDPENALARVEFYRGTTLISSDTTSPYTATWTGAAAGTYSLTAVAVDAAGNRTTSGAVSITVGNPPTTPPKSVIFQKSTDNDTLVTSYRLDVFASGANPATATPVASVNLGKPTPASNGDITVNESTFFTALAPGTYQATVSAIGSGGQSRSAAITFTR
jgi:regulation of enolase protein 1 (concanavalin A-like superfamily)